MFTIKSISSLNLRRARGLNIRPVSDVILYNCSVCKKKKKLGYNSGMMVKIAYILGPDKRELLMCDLCADVFCDLACYGPRVVTEVSYWTRKSILSRVSLIQQNLLCANCLKKLDTHLFFKYDDLRVAHKSEVFQTKRLCAKCVISYLAILLSSKSIRKAKLLRFKPPKFGERINEFQ